MVFAHLPAGYLLTKVLQKRMQTTSLLWAGLLGSVLPDFDILYFYLVDAQQFSHRSYITHWPLFWLGVAYLVLPFVRILGSREAFVACVFLFVNIGLHMVLDSVVAPVYWLQPLSDQSFQVLKLSYNHHYSFWLWNYMAHPAFLMEITACVLGGIMFLKHRVPAKICIMREIFDRHSFWYKVSSSRRVLNISFWVRAR